MRIEENKRMRNLAAHRNGAAKFLIVQFFSLFLFQFFVSSCGAPDGSFRIKGKFRNFNQGELYLYTLQKGGKGYLDTIRVLNGRFSYETAVDTATTFSLVFPNYSEIPIFVESGIMVDIDGDASHLKEVEVSGSDDNEEMTAFRLAANELTPPEVEKRAREYIKDYPGSPVSLYLAEKFLPADSITKLPAFSDIDTNGRRVSNSTMNGDINVIYTWASWNFDSQDMQRQLKKQKKTYGSRLALLAVCLDARLVPDASRILERDSITWSNVCNGQLWNVNVLKQIGLAEIPGNIVTDRSGNILARNLSARKLQEKIESLLK
jgi:hypothetical protein